METASETRQVQINVTLCINQRFAPVQEVDWIWVTRLHNSWITFSVWIVLTLSESLYTFALHNSLWWWIPELNHASHVKLCTLFILCKIVWIFFSFLRSAVWSLRNLSQSEGEQKRSNVQVHAEMPDDVCHCEICTGISYECMYSAVHEMCLKLGLFIMLSHPLFCLGAIPLQFQNIPGKLEMVCWAL